MTQNQQMIVIVDDAPADRATYRRYRLQGERYTYRMWAEEYGERALELY